jgi:hypothetical protein
MLMNPTVCFGHERLSDFGYRILFFRPLEAVSGPSGQQPNKRESALERQLVKNESAHERPLTRGGRTGRPNELSG